MTTLLPTSQSTGVEAYEDMFKEITRKLYGDESAHGLYPHNTQVAQLAPGAPTAPPDGGERSFTTLTQIGYETTTVGAGSGPSSQQQQQQQQHQQSSSASSSAASTAFGLAALMQNGFPPPGTMLNPVNFPPGTASKTPTNISNPSGDSRWQTPGDESWSTGKHSSSSGGYGSKSYKKPKTEPHDGGGGSSSLNIPSTADRSGSGTGGSGKAGRNSYGSAQRQSSSPSESAQHGYKRYSCTTCPYTTDRRDLFTRHENIHKDEKPFQCYACLKPFNRADHVKKHFIRMHRELEYDIAKTRRYPPSASSASGRSSSSSKAAATGYYGQSTSGTSAASGTTNAAPSTVPSAMQLNIPSGSSFGTGSGLHALSLPAHAHEAASLSQHHLASSAGLNGGQLLQLHNLHQQHQQQQQHHHHSGHLHPSISIKQEKGIAAAAGASGLSNHNTSASSAGAPPDDKSFVKKIKGEKKFACTFCPWAGTDNWGLKRHLNTHTKPYVCLLCDYKAARSERLATHVLKVHNKKACGKCSFFAEDQAHLEAHLQEAHPHDPTKASKGGGGAGGGGNSSNGHCGSTASHHPAVGSGAPPNGNVLRNLGNAFTSNHLPTNIPTSGNGFGAGTSANGHPYTAAGHHAATGHVLTNSNAANLIDTIQQHLAAGGGLAGDSGAPGTLQQHQQQHQHWLAKAHLRKRNGPELLYSYLEADGSDSGDYARLLHMQAVGRNKASVTQDFHNAGGGDNGINGDHSSSNGSSMTATNTTINGGSGAVSTPRFGVVPVERLRKDPRDRDGPNVSNMGNKATTDNSVALSLASLLGGDQLSFLQLLATAAVAHQQLQLHSSAQQTLPSQSSGVQPKQQKHQHHQSQPKPSKAAAVQQKAVAGAPNDRDRYGSMVSSPPATGIISTQQQQQQQHQQHAREASAAAAAAAAASSTSIKNGSNSTNGTTTIIIPSAVATVTPMVEPCGGGAGGALVNGFKKRRLNGSSSSDKENLILRKAGGHLQVAAASIVQTGGTNVVVNGGSIIAGGHHHPSAGSKVGHNHHHHNNNNCSTSNKNINDIFDKVYKKPQNSFASGKHQQLLLAGVQLPAPPPAHSLPASLLRIAPPSAAEEEEGSGHRRYSRPVVTVETEGQQFSLTEFLKNHTEVSISTVGEGTTGTVAAKQEKEREPVADPSKEKDLPAPTYGVPPKKRKQQQPRRFDECDGDAQPLTMTTVEPVTKNRLMANGTEQPDLQSSLPDTPASTPEAAHGGEESETLSNGHDDRLDAIDMSSSDESNVSRLADIRDKHMTQLVSRRRCCRICQNQGRLDHLDNCHYHSKISLILHTRWRHGALAAGGETTGSSAAVRCRQCGSQFRQRYQLALHKRLTQHTGMTGSLVRPGRRRKKIQKTKDKRSNGKENVTNNTTSTSTIATNAVAISATIGANAFLPVKMSQQEQEKKNPSLNNGRKRKQRKRKPRSRCFTVRRRK